MRISDWSSDVCSSDLDVSPEAVLTRAVLDAHLASGTETSDALRRRLRAAANDIDLAAIFTIHGFCARVLREHALEVGQAFDVPELLTSDTALHEAIAADLWRWPGRTDAPAEARKSAVEGKRVAVRVDPGGCRL